MTKLHYKLVLGTIYALRKVSSGRLEVTDQSQQCIILIRFGQYYYMHTSREIIIKDERATGSKVQDKNYCSVLNQLGTKLGNAHKTRQDLHHICLYILLHFHETVSAVALQGSVRLAAYQS